MNGNPHLDIMQLPIIGEAILALLLSANVLNANYVFNEICMGDTFEPECSAGSQILIKRANIGRIKYGKCLPENSGPIGCFENVEGYLDSECFGKSQCSIYVPDRQLMAANPCSSALGAHLEVEYECVSGNEYR